VGGTVNTLDVPATLLMKMEASGTAVRGIDKFGESVAQV